MKYTLVGDISGRISYDTTYNTHATVAMVAVATDVADLIRSKIHRGFPKWRDAKKTEVEHILYLLKNFSVAMPVITVYLATKEWDQFQYNTQLLYNDIINNGERKAGFIKATNIVKSQLFIQAAAFATAHIARSHKYSRTVDSQGFRLIIETIIIDSDIQGDENVDLFRSCLYESNLNQRGLKKHDIRVMIDDVEIQREEDEPLILLPDYLAGIVQAAHIKPHNCMHISFSKRDLQGLINYLSESKNFTMHSEPLTLKYEDMFYEMHSPSSLS